MKKFNEWVISEAPKYTDQQSNGICPFCFGTTVDDDNSRDGGMQCADCGKKWSCVCPPADQE